MADDKVVIRLLGENAQLKQKLKETESGFKRLGKSAQGLGGILAGVFAIGTVARFAGAVIDLAAKQERAEVKLAAVIKATGGAAGFTAKQMYDMATAMQRATIYGDEIVMDGMAILATFKNIRGEEFKDATMLMGDLAEIMRVDLFTAAKQLGKALHDPGKGLAALSRGGVTFTNAQQDMVKELVNAGKVVEAQKIILDELKGQVEGVAAAMENTFSGRVESLKNRLGDLGEVIGHLVIPAIEGLFNIMQPVISMLESTANQASSTRDSFFSIGKVISEYLTPVFSFFGDMYISIFTMLETVAANWKTALEMSMKGAYLTIVEFTNNVVHLFTEIIPKTLEWMWRNWRDILTDIMNFTKVIFTNIAKNIYNFVEAIKQLFAGGGWEFDWTDLTKGFKSSIQEALEFADRVPTQLEKRLDEDVKRLSKKLHKAYEDNKAINKRVFEEMFQDARPEIDIDAIQADPNALKAARAVTTFEGGGKGKGGALTGLLELSNRIQSAASKRDPTELNTKETATTLKEMRAEAKRRWDENKRILKERNVTGVQFS